MNKLRVIVVAANEDNRILAKSLLADENIAIAAYVDCKPSSYVKITGIYPDVVFFIDEDDPTIYEMNKKLYVAMPGALLTLVSIKNDADFMRYAIECGFHLILPATTPQKELIQRIFTAGSVEKKRLTDEQRRITNARVISVYGSKGGCGKTVVATNLAVMLAGKNKRVMLIDCNLQFGDISLYMDVTPKDTISELVQDDANFSVESVNNTTIAHSSGVAVLAAPKSPEFADYVAEAHIERLINISRPYYDFIIIDLPVTLSNITLIAIENTDTVLYTATPDIASLKDMHQTLKIMKSLQQSEKFKLVLNRVGTGSLTQKDFVKNIAIPLAGSLRDDEPAVSQSIGRGIPLALSAHKGNRLAADYRALASYILNLQE